MKLSGIQAAAVVVVVIIVLAATGIFTYHGTTGSVLNPTSSTTGPTTNNQANQAGQGCATTAVNAYKVLGTHITGDASISNLVWDRFTENSQAANAPGQPLGQLQGQIDQPGTVTDGTLSSLSANSYALSSYDLLTQTQNPGTANTYNQWIYEPAITTLPYSVSQFGFTTYQATCQSTSNNIYFWTFNGVLFEAPGSGNSSTTNVKAVVIYPTGSAPATWPTSAQTWQVQLQIFQSYKAAMLSVPECGTTSLPVTNYASGTTYHDCGGGAPGQNGLPTLGGYLIISSNVTGISVQAPGLQNVIANKQSGTYEAIVPVSGCAPAPGSGVSSSSPYICANIPVTLYETGSQGSQVGNINFFFVDNQDPAFLKQYLTNGAQTSYSSTHWMAIASTAGVPHNLSGLTPTTSANAGAQRTLIEQYVGFEGTY